MVDINYDEQIAHQKTRLAEVTALKIKLEGAIEMLELLKQEAERKVEAAVEKVEEVAKTVEAEIVGK